MSTMYRIRLAPLIFILFMPLIGWAIDLQPNDIVAPPPGKNLITISYFNTENSTLYANGSVNSRGLYTNLSSILKAPFSAALELTP